MVDFLKPARLHRLRRLMVAAAIALVGLASPTWAMRVSPMVAEITVSGAGSSARIEVQNLAGSPLPYETSITRITFGEAGELIETPADDDFLVFPPQGIAPAGGRQVIRAQWVGDPGLQASRAYYMTIRQLPIDFEGQEGRSPASVQVVYHMKTLIIVAPDKIESQVSLVSMEPTEIAPAPVAETVPSEVDVLTGTEAVSPAVPAEPGKPQPAVSVRLRNDGLRHAVMSGVTWIIEGSALDGTAQTLTLAPSQVSGLIGVGYLPPEGGERAFVIPVEQPFAPGSLRIRFAG